MNNKFVKEYSHNGKVYLESRKGSEYTLYFKNNSAKQVKVIFSVDGLSVIDGKEASDKSKGYIVSAYRHIEIPGWTIDNSTAAKFEFRPQGDKENSSYVENLKSEGFDVDILNQGVIGCLVFKEKYIPPEEIHHHHYYNPYTIWPVLPYNGPGVPPYISDCYDYSSVYKPRRTRSSICSDTSIYQSQITASAASPMGMGISSASPMGLVGQNSQFYIKDDPINAAETSLGTGFGEDTSFKTTSVEFEAEKNPDWTGVIFYDTIVALKKMGVVIDDKSEKQAFPGYTGEFCRVPRKR